MEYAQLTPGPGFDPTRSFLYYGQRLVTAPRIRQLVIAGLRAGIRLRQGSHQCAAPLAEEDEKTLQLLRRSGFASLKTLLSREQIGDIHAFLRMKNLRGRHKSDQVFTIENVPSATRIADYDLKDIIDCPHLLELANRPSLLRLASHYLGCKPTISGIVLRWSFPSSGDGMDVQLFHRDSDDWRFVKIFVYLTDVDTESGPHVYVRGTHLTKASLRLRPYSDSDILEAYGSDDPVIVTGPSGFGFAADTAGIHKGMIPSGRARLMLQIQYSILPAYAYRYQPETYKGSLELDRYINRLFLK